MLEKNSVCETDFLLFFRNQIYSIEREKNEQEGPEEEEETEMPAEYNRHPPSTHKSKLVPSDLLYIFSLFRWKDSHSQDEGLHHLLSCSQFFRLSTHTHSECSRDRSYEDSPVPRFAHLSPSLAAGGAATSFPFFASFYSEIPPNSKTSLVSRQIFISGYTVENRTFDFVSRSLHFPRCRCVCISREIQRERKDQNISCLSFNNAASPSDLPSSHSQADFHQDRQTKDWIHVHSHNTAVNGTD